MKRAQHVVTLSRMAESKPTDEWVNRRMKFVTERVVGSTRAARGWKASVIGHTTVEVNGQYKTLARLNITLNAHKERRPDSIEAEWQNILNKIIGRAIRKSNFTIYDVDNQIVEQQSQANSIARKRYVDIIIQPNWKDNFQHIYARDAQIDITMANAYAALDSAFENRFHVLLHGEPASGKTEISRSFIKVVGADAVLEYDGTNITSAGVIRDINERDELPRFLIIEEIEKVTNEDCIKWLLSLMDDRAEIRKVNFRVNIQRETKMVVIATANNYEAVKKMMSGALASRFTKHLYCPRPTKEILKLILERELSKFANGKIEWVQPTLDYCEKRKITDPRIVKDIMFSGKDNLLDNSYQLKLDECTKTI